MYFRHLDLPKFNIANVDSKISLSPMVDGATMKGVSMCVAFERTLVPNVPYIDIVRRNLAVSHTLTLLRSHGRALTQYYTTST